MKKITGNKHLEPIDQNSYAAWTEERGKTIGECGSSKRSAEGDTQHCYLLQVL